MEIQVKFDPHDIWIGIYWKLSKSIESPYRQLDVYICAIPLFPIRFRFEWGWRDTPKNMAVRKQLSSEHYERMKADWDRLHDRARK